MIYIFITRSQPKMDLNIIITENQPLKRVEVTEIRLRDNIAFSDLKRFASAIEGRTDGVVYTGYGTIGTTSQISEEMIQQIIGTSEFELVKRTLDSSKEIDLGVLEKIARSIVKKIFPHIGYTISENNRVLRGDFKNNRGMRAYDALQYRVFVTPSGKIGLVLDHVVRNVAFLSELLEAGAMGLADIQGIPVFVPYGSGFKSGEIIGVDNVGMDDLRDLNNIRTTSLRSFYKNSKKHYLDKWQIDIDNCHLVVLVRIDGEEDRVLSYPLCVVRKALSPKDRLLKFTGNRRSSFENVAVQIEHLSSIRFGDQTVTFARTSGNALLQEGFARGHFDYPQIEFGGGNTMKVKKGYNINQGLARYGPYSGEKNLRVHIVHPSTFVQAKDLMKEIIETARALNLGSWESGNIISLSKGHNEFNSTINQKEESDVVVAIPGRTANNSYDAIMHKLAERNIVSKGIEAKTATKALRDSRRPNTVLSVMVRSLYSRYCGDTEALCVLASDPQILEGYTFPVILSMDISRDPGSVKSHSATISAMDKKGLILKSPSRSKFSEGYFNPEDVKTWILEVLKGITREHFSRYRDFPDLFIYIHDGTMSRQQVEAFKKGIDLAMKEFRNITSKSSEFIISEVTKKVPLRFLSDVGEGSWLKDYDDTLWLKASEPSYKLGDAQLLRIRINHGDRSMIVKLAELLYFLRFINPVTPFNYTRVPYMQHLAHKSSNDRRVVGDRGFIPY